MQSQCSSNRVFRRANELENIFNQVFGPTASGSAKFAPPADVIETDSSFLINLELPGVKLDEISVEFVEDMLQISGEKKIANDGSDKACHCSERRSGTFQRTFRFPTDVETDKVEARLENGVLTIQLPKAAKVLPRKIEIKASN